MKGWLTASRVLTYHIASVYYWPDHTNAYTSSAFPRCKHWGVVYLTQFCIHATINNYSWRLTNLRPVAFIYEMNIDGTLWNMPVFKLYHFVCVYACAHVCIQSRVSVLTFPPMWYRCLVCSCVYQVASHLRRQHWDYRCLWLSEAYVGSGDLNSCPCRKHSIYWGNFQVCEIMCTFLLCLLVFILSSSDWHPFL